MLKLALIASNSAGTSVIALLGMIMLALVAAVTLGLWVFVASRQAGRARREAEASADDESLETLRHRRLVVQPAAGPQGAVVAELQPTDEAAPADLAAGGARPTPSPAPVGAPSRR